MSMSRSRADVRNHALCAAIVTLKKRLGAGAILKLSEAADMKVEAIPTHEGVSTAGDLPDPVVECAILQKRDAFYTFGDTRLNQGRKNAQTLLQQNDFLCNSIDSQIRQAIGLPGRFGSNGDTARVA